MRFSKTTTLKNPVSIPESLVTQRALPREERPPTHESRGLERGRGENRNDTAHVKDEPVQGTFRGICWNGEPPAGCKAQPLSRMRAGPVRKRGPTEGGVCVINASP